MKLFKYSADLYPVSVTLIAFVLSLLPFVKSTPLYWSLAVAGLFMRLLSPIHQHCHSHQATFTRPWVNGAYDFVLSLVTGSLTANWKVHHGLGHHVDFLDQKNDVEGNLRFGEDIRYRRFKFALLGSLLGLTDSVKLLNRMPQKAKRFHIRSIANQLALQIIAFMILFYINPIATFVIFLVPNFILQFGVFWFSYGQHDGLPMTNVYDSSTTKFKFGFWLLNVEHHTAHHEKPGLHWSKLSDRTIEILPLIHKDCLK